jgi:hypothetical protein
MIDEVCMVRKTVCAAMLSGAYFTTTGGASMHRIALFMVVALLGVSVGHSSKPAADWAINATAIEACSCPHFCVCYFNAHPAAHHEGGKTEQYKVNKGHYGNVDLTGAKIWLSGDLARLLAGPDGLGGRDLRQRHDC